MYATVRTTLRKMVRRDSKFHLEIHLFGGAGGFVLVLSLVKRGTSSCRKMLTRWMTWSGLKEVGYIITGFQAIWEVPELRPLAGFRVNSLGCTALAGRRCTRMELAGELHRSFDSKSCSYTKGLE